MKSILTKGRVFLGKLNRNASSKPGSGPRNCSAYLEWELRQAEHGPEFSMSGEVWNSRKTDVFWAGQCCDKLVAKFPGHTKARRMVEVWQQYHLNDMQAGLPSQMAEIERRTQLARQQFPEAVYPDGDVNWYRMAELHGLKKEYEGQSMGPSHYELVLSWLKETGLYEVPVASQIADGTLLATGGFPAEVVNGTRGYRYGERWVYLPIPQPILDEIMGWAPKAPAEQAPI